MKLDPARSRVTLNTFAEGLFSALAHDLAIETEGLDGALEGSDEARVAEVRVPIARLRVAGAVKRGKLDTGALSASDRESILRQIREEVLRGGAEVTARGTAEGARRARIAIAVPAGGRTEVTCDVERTDAGGGAVSARGSFDLSLRALGIAPVKGPLGAFKLSDRVRVTFDLVFTAG